MIISTPMINPKARTLLGFIFICVLSSSKYLIIPADDIRGGVLSLLLLAFAMSRGVCGKYITLTP